MNSLLEMRSYCCPHCGVLLSVDCCEVGSAHPHDVVLDLA
jgi:acetone carboxylase gamma subunit